MLPVALGVLFGRRTTLALYEIIAGITASLSVILFSLQNSTRFGDRNLWQLQGLEQCQTARPQHHHDYWYVADSHHIRLFVGCDLWPGLPGVWAGTLLDNGFSWLF